MRGHGLWFPCRSSSHRTAEARATLIGRTFVAVNGIIYFASMAASWQCL